MRARHPDVAARTVLPIVVVCAVILAVFTRFGPNSASTTTQLATWATVALLVVLAVVLRLLPAERLDRAGLLLACAVGGALLVDGLNLLTRDASAAAQAFLAFPVLWGAAQLRRGAVVVTTATAVVTNAGVVGLLLPPQAAVADALAFGAALVVFAVMLLRAGEEQDRLVTMLQQQATVDSLTGLVNRRVLDDALDRALTEPTGSLGTALVLVDIDAFKAINDQYGHPVGDDALVHVAGLLRSVVRSGDAVLSRMGGDELAVLLPECPPSAAVQRAEQLLGSVRDTPLTLHDGTRLAVSVSVGVAHAPTQARGLEALYAAADAALYTAKRGGRGRVAVA